MCPKKNARLGFKMGSSFSFFSSSSPPPLKMTDVKYGLDSVQFLLLFLLHCSFFKRQRLGGKKTFQISLWKKVPFQKDFFPLLLGFILLGIKCQSAAERFRSSFLSRTISCNIYPIYPKRSPRREREKTTHCTHFFFALENIMEKGESHTHTHTGRGGGRPEAINNLRDETCGGEEKSIFPRKSVVDRHGRWSFSHGFFFHSLFLSSICTVCSTHTLYCTVLVCWMVLQMRVVKGVGKSFCFCFAIWAAADVLSIWQPCYWLEKGEEAGSERERESTPHVKSWDEAEEGLLQR